MRVRFRVLWPFFAAVFLAALLFLHERGVRSLPTAITPPPQLQQAEILQGVEPLEIVPVDYPRTLDFGKGKFSLFDFSVPAAEDFRLERLVVSVDGATDEEMPQAWLRLNGVRIYTVTDFHSGEAIFTAFPPVESGNADIDRVSLGDIPHERLQNAQEAQILLKPLQPLSQLLPAGSTVSVGIYGKWVDDITPRPAKSGIRFCLKEISGVMTKNDQPAKTSFAQPICWPRMGIQ